MVRLAGIVMVGQTAAIDRLAQWCSVRESGNRAQFDEACIGVISDDESPAVVLSRLEMVALVDVDWESGRWAALPTCVAMIPGSGGNAVVVGARTEGTWSALEELRNAGGIAAVTAVTTDPRYPASWYVGVRNSEELRRAAEAVRGTAVDGAARTQLDHFFSLAEVVASSATKFVPSGFQPRQFDPEKLRFAPVDVSRDAWPSGCYEQRALGRNVYIYVDDNGKRHIVDRWVGVHAELRRARSRGKNVQTILSWDPHSERLANLASARLPTQWARTAVLCTGLAPRQVRTGEWVDLYEGVPASVFAGICKALEIPTVASDLSRFDHESRT